MKILLLDNYDSFTYNLYHQLEKIANNRIDVIRNDAITLEGIASYDKIILSPGPGIPSEAGLLLALIREYSPSKSILGVCLGHQAIAESFGATLHNLEIVFHGVAHKVRVLKNDTMWKAIPDSFDGGRYHSWVVQRDNLPDSLEILADDEFGNIMAIRHATFDVRGVQFHPESVLTQFGEILLKNWLRG